MQNFQDLKCGISKRSCEISRGLGFWPWMKFPRDVTYIILRNFQGWSFELCEISRGTEKNQKILIYSGFFKNVCPHPPLPLFVCFFLEQSVPPKTINLNWSYAAPGQKEALTILSSVLGRLTQLHLWHQLIGERSTPTWEEVKPPSFPCIPNIHIGENPQPYSNV